MKRADVKDRVVDRSAVELMPVNRRSGSERTDACGSCGQVRVLTHGIFVGSYGEPCGAVEICSSCAPKAERLVANIVGLLPLEAAAMLKSD